MEEIHTVVVRRQMETIPVREKADILPATTTEDASILLVLSLLAPKVLMLALSRVWSRVITNALTPSPSLNPVVVVPLLVGARTVPLSKLPGTLAANLVAAKCIPAPKDIYSLPTTNHVSPSRFLDINEVLFMVFLTVVTFLPRYRTNRPTACYAPESSYRMFIQFLFFGFLF
jgi:hypothetical protein